MNSCYFFLYLYPLKSSITPSISGEIPLITWEFLWGIPMKPCKSHGIAHILPIRAAFRNSIWMYLDQSMGILIAKTWSTSLVLKHVPSGKHTKNYGKSPFYSWVNQLFLWPFSIAMFVYQRVCFSISGNRIHLIHLSNFLEKTQVYKKSIVTHSQ